MGILFTGIGLLIMGVLVGILKWTGETGTFRDWADYQEQRKFEQQQEELWWTIWRHYF